MRIKLLLGVFISIMLLSGCKAINEGKEEVLDKTNISDETNKNNEQPNDVIEEDNKPTYNVSAMVANGSDITTDGKYVYYINYSDNCKIYKVDLNGQNNKLVADYDCIKIFYYDNYIYFTERTEDHLQSMFSRINLQTLEYKVISDEIDVWNFTIKDNFVYLIAANGEVNEADFPIAKLMKIDLNSSEFKVETLDDEHSGYIAGDFTITDNAIYYGLNYDTFKYDINEKQACKIDRFGGSLQCLDNNVYSISQTKINKYDTTLKEESVVCNSIDNLEINCLSVGTDELLFSTFDEAKQLIYIYKYDFSTKDIVKILKLRTLKSVYEP